MPRWILVSNRLPFSVNSESGKVERGSGGLVTALMGIHGMDSMIWAGTLSNANDAPTIRATAKKLGFEDLLPIVVSDTLYDDYYNGFSNDVLWPLFHYQSSLVRFRWDNWQAYIKVNERFAEELLKILEDDDLVWIHDFHLCLLPLLLKRRKPNLRIGFFLHVPWPTSEIFRQLPVREELLQGILAADLVGFHDSAYVRHFSSSVQAILGFNSDLHYIHANHDVRLGVFPVSIDVDNYQQSANSSQVRKLLNLQHSRDRPLQILGVDRLDYSKGLDLKLEMFRQFLKNEPHFVGKVQLVQVAVPTRQSVPEYQRLKGQIDQLVGEINGQFSRPGYTPVNYIFSPISFHSLLALYRGSRALLVTSTRDGMNLVAMEYLMCQNKKNPGVLLLSEFTGASSLLSACLLINPWNIEGSARTLARALEMPIDERVRAHKEMFKFLKTYSSSDWAQSFMQALQKTRSDQDFQMRILHKKQTDRDWSFPNETLKALSGTSRLAIILDYDGTLVPIAKVPQDAVLPASTKRLLKNLCRKIGVELYVVSGRSRNFLRSQFDGIPIHLAAEHGSEFCAARSSEWIIPTPVRRSKWYLMTAQIMQEISARVPRSFVEKKSRGLVWHYRESPKEFAEYQARKLEVDLRQGLSNFPVSIIQGKKVIEVRSIDANKGTFVAHLKASMNSSSCIFLAIGDDQTDEDIFEALRSDQNSICIKIGKGPTHAGWRLKSQNEVIQFLEWLNSIRI